MSHAIEIIIKVVLFLLGLWLLVSGITNLQRPTSGGEIVAAIILFILALIVFSLAANLRMDGSKQQYSQPWGGWGAPNPYAEAYRPSWRD